MEVKIDLGEVSLKGYEDQNQRGLLSERATEHGLDLRQTDEDLICSRESRL